MVPDGPGDVIDETRAIVRVIRANDGTAQIAASGVPARQPTNYSGEAPTWVSQRATCV